jgi:hypothetical protein
LWRNRIRPSTPLSFVKFAIRLASVTTGCSSSTPTRPHVPQLMYAKSSETAGTATTALAVSCEPIAVTTGAPLPPTSDATAGSSGPIAAPASTSRGNSSRG